MTETKQKIAVLEGRIFPRSRRGVDYDAPGRIMGIFDLAPNKTEVGENDLIMIVHRPGHSYRGSAHGFGRDYAEASIEIHGHKEVLSSHLPSPRARAERLKVVSDYLAKQYNVKWDTDIDRQACVVRSDRVSKIVEWLNTWTKVVVEKEKASKDAPKVKRMPFYADYELRELLHIVMDSALTLDEIRIYAADVRKRKKEYDNGR